MLDDLRTFATNNPDLAFLLTHATISTSEQSLTAPA